MSHAEFVPISFEKQLYDYGCGIAVLVSALNYWDIHVDQEQLAKQYPPKLIQSGYTIGELKTIAHEQELHAFALKSDLITIKKHLQKGRPIIVPVEVDSDYIIDQSMPFLGILSRSITKLITPSYHHYVLVFGFNETKIWLMDPVFGIISIDEINFLKIWSKKEYAMILLSK